MNFDLTYFLSIVMEDMKDLKLYSKTDDLIQKTEWSTLAGHK